MHSRNENLLREVIDARSARLGLNVSLDNIRYFNEIEFRGWRRGGHALYVGIGHGHDALAALCDGQVDHVTGIDPYIGEHGNNDVDMSTLLEVAAALGLENRLTVIKGTAQQYLSERHDDADIIILNDVLHHIFETPRPLSRSDLYSSSVQFFAQLSEIRPQARLVIYDSVRYGLRALLNNRRVTKLDVDYTTKQEASEWRKAATEGGWVHSSTEYYVPHRLRQFASFVRSSPWRVLVADHYLSRFERR